MSVLTLSVGDFAPLFMLPAHTGDLLDVRDLQGEPIVLFVFSQEAIALLCSLRDLYPELQQLGIHLIGISTNSIETHAQMVESYHLPFPLVSDREGQMVKALGLYRENGEVNCATLVINPNFRILKVYCPVEEQAHPTQLLADLRKLLVLEPPRHVPMQAPVLIIPNVLDPEFCQYLIHVWETQGNGDSGFMKQEGDETVGKYDYSRKIRRDHFVENKQLRDRIRTYLNRRVCLEIWKAFNFQVTRFEDFRIACYESSRGGYFRAHRDNTTSATAHRRFAMTLNLNAGEYEGGYLKFPEYGPYLYRPDTGSAVIFSCSLLHEATDVTAGRRFVLLSFFYGEQEAKLRQEILMQEKAKKS